MKFKVEISGDCFDDDDAYKAIVNFRENYNAILMARAEIGRKIKDCDDAMEAWLWCLLDILATD